MPHPDRRPADKGFERLVIGHQFVETEPFDDEMVDQIAAQPVRAVEQFGEELCQAAVLVVDDADLPHPVTVARRERVADRLPERAFQMHRAELAKTLHQPVQVAPVGHQIEFNKRLDMPVARGQPDLPGFRQGLVDAGEQ